MGKQGLTFQRLNKAYNRTFQPARMTIGLVLPLAAYPNTDVPSMQGHLQRVQLAEQLGFSAVWLRDVPFKVPSFGDVGQQFDPFVYLGYLAAATQQISLGVASIVLPLRHPVHVAKSAASIEQLSGGRLILGVASGDRPEEYPAMNLDYQLRGERFRESFTAIRQLQTDYPQYSNHYGQLTGELDLLPKNESRIPMLITGSSQQSPDWRAENGDGWMLYPREINAQQQQVASWRERLATENKPDQPMMQPLYFDLDESGTSVRKIHLGFRSGTDYLLDYLRSLEQIGINHVALNLRFNQAGIEETLFRLADEILPAFNQGVTVSAANQIDGRH